MKSRLILALGSFVLVAITTASSVFAANLKLTKIGGLDLGGKTYSQWWYTGTRPTFYGTSDPSDAITVTAGTETFTGVTDTDGNWAVSVPLGTGDYNISVTNEDETYSFTLHLGQEFPGGGATTQTTQSTSGNPVPQTGLNQTSAILLGTGVSLLALYFYFFESNKKRVLFEREIVGD